MRDKVAIIIIFILVMAIIITNRMNKKVEYEYYANGEFGKSNECYQDKNQDCYCKVDKKEIKVDIYYVVE